MAGLLGAGGTAKLKYIQFRHTFSKTNWASRTDTFSIKNNLSSLPDRIKKKITANDIVVLFDFYLSSTDIQGETSMSAIVTSYNPETYMLSVKTNIGYSGVFNDVPIRVYYVG